MRLLSRIMSAIGTALRRTFRRLANGVLWPVIEWSTSFVDGLFHRGTIETEEFIDDGLQHDTDRRVDAAIELSEEQKLPLGKRIRLACQRRQAGQDWSHLFDARDQHQRRTVKWVATLDEAAVGNAMRCAPLTLERHLDPGDAWSTGLPRLEIPTDERRRAVLAGMSDELRLQAETAKVAAAAVRQNAKRKGRRPSISEIDRVMGVAF